jgi:glycosyltransferase involved in cell wall biosynthesis/lauroyl/myristoyl acyltransferase
MPAIAPEHIEVGTATNSGGLDQAASHRRSATMSVSLDTARKYVASLAIWVLYVPHYTILWFLGPRVGLVWVRLAANVHWLLTFLGAQRATRRSLEKLHPLLGTNLSVSAILRRHLELKHECFARVRVYNLHGANSRLVDIRWHADPSCLPAVPKMENRDRGLVVVGYHFGFFQLSSTALSQVVAGCNPVQLRYRIARCADQAMSPIARLVMRRAIDADRRSGAPIFYIDGDTSLLKLFKLLRKSGCLSVAADGMLADEFVEVPFFDGTLRVPFGWARLAAATKSDILLLYDTRIDAHHRAGWFYNHVACRDSSATAIERAVAEAVAVLEMAIRREPWAWHPWQRLQWEQGADGSPRYQLRQFGAGLEDAAKLDLHGPRMERELSAKPAATRLSTDSVDEPSGSVENTPVAIAVNGAPSMNRISEAKGAARDGRPSVAIICNSLTPYRIHLHERIVAEVPEIELWSLATHANAYDRWSGRDVPATIRPVDFSHGEPTNEQTQPRHSLREWRKGGRINEWLSEHNISAVFCQGCGDAGRLRILHRSYRRGIPCFLTGDFNICSDRLVGPKRWLKHAVYQRAIEWSTGLLPCGIRGASLFNRYGGGSKIQFLFPFVPDVRSFEQTPEDAIEEMGKRFRLSPLRRRIVFSARMMQAKRPDLALKAFAAIADERPDWDLVMLGDGELRASLTQRVPTNLRDRVCWTGFLHEIRDVAGIYALSDVLLLPSDHEPWGVVVAEAAAAGLAIVTSDVVGAAPELVHNGRNGQQFPAGDIQSLVRALRMSTAPDWIDEGKRQSRIVLGEWLANADPILGFRAALAFSRLITNSTAAQKTEGQRAITHTPESILAAR